ncbi:MULTISPECIES: cell envelope integrity protein CreD [Rhodomicrobium]|uniref:cell envelope integrity protein CreD n=1 Tax=Rhodomicrobium TaxID=1068 RepID=UPI000B4B4F13|nr:MULTISPECIES: cell envelope integrity protein CreD [Rhodomicrobium]
MATSFADAISRFTRSPGFKFFLVAGLILLLTIPLALIWLLVSEREARSRGVALEIAGQFGGEQRIIGPLLIVPYSVTITRVRNDKSVEDTETRYAVFLPDDFAAEGEAKSEVRRRSIYDVTVYSGRVKLTGRFAAPDIRLVDPDAATVRWRDAFLSLGLSDVSGLKEAAAITLDGARRIAFEPSAGLPSNVTPGLNARLFPVDASVDQPPAAFSFETELVFNGSSSLTIAPIGRETRITLASDWRHPSFVGAFLPDRREIRNDGFNATWRIPHLARSVPQAWRVDANATMGIHNSLAMAASGVNFYVPVDYYDLVNRAAKYGLMFLAVAFFAVLVLELTSGRRVHPVQYVFVGVAMILFYVLLLSFAEHIGFTAAYLIASVATGGMLSLYVGKSLHSSIRGLVMLCVFLILYGLLYLILRLEDYAMLAGAVAGFVMLTVTMFATLRVNWSGEAAQT